MYLGSFLGKQTQKSALVRARITYLFSHVLISTAESVHKVQRWSENYDVTLPHAQNFWISN